MTDKIPFSSLATSAFSTLLVRRTIRATPERLFEAWTDPSQLLKWWGPRPAVCTQAEVDLRVGGKYRLANQFPNGELVWILGEFEVIEPPTRLVYTWRIELREIFAPERVTVRFEKIDQEGTEVTIIHERIESKESRDSHEQGWEGCLDKLVEYVGNLDNQN